MTRFAPWQSNTLDGFLDRLGDTLVNLVTIEVNTIEAPGMTGRKMPRWPQAILDVADRYFDYMKKAGGLSSFFEEGCRAASDALGADGNGEPSQRTEEAAIAVRTAIYGGKSGLQADDAARTVLGSTRREAEPGRQGEQMLYDPAQPLPQVRIDRPTFLVLREVARAMERLPALHAHLGGDEEGRRVILNRIMRNCDQIIGILQYVESQDALSSYIGKDRDAPQMLEDETPPLPASAATRLRKIWDINTERIVYQTLFQLDGDVVTRLAGRAKDLEQNPAWQAHQQNLALSIGHWEKMFRVVERLVRRR